MPENPKLPADPPLDDIPLDDIALIGPGEVIATLEELRAHPSRKFRLRRAEAEIECFVALSEGEPRAWRNRCPHAGTPLDWTPNEFFEPDSGHLMCRTHGALFEADNGECVSGPCRGRGLEPIPIEVGADGMIRLKG